MRLSADGPSTHQHNTAPAKAGARYAEWPGYTEWPLHTSERLCPGPPRSSHLLDLQKAPHASSACLREEVHTSTAQPHRSSTEPAQRRPRYAERPHHTSGRLCTRQPRAPPPVIEMCVPTRQSFGCVGGERSSPLPTGRVPKGFRV